jgi:hypothetical protein
LQQPSQQQHQRQRQHPGQSRSRSSGSLGRLRTFVGWFRSCTENGVTAQHPHAAAAASGEPAVTAASDAPEMFLTAYTHPPGAKERVVMGIRMTGALAER